MNSTQMRLVFLLLFGWALSCKAPADSFAPIPSQLVKPKENQANLSTSEEKQTLSGMANFSGSTEVTVRSRPEAIKSIKVGSPVDAAGAKGSERKVVSVSKGVANSLVEVLTVARDRIETTPHTQFWVNKKGWVPASALFPGDKLTSRNGGLIQVFNVKPESTTGTDVFSLRLEKGGNYYVGKSAVLVRGI